LLGHIIAVLRWQLHKFFDTRSMSYKTRSNLRHEPPADFMRFSVADPAHADAFLAEFGGERITIEPHKPVGLH
jgi:hypothetical protein